jgi:very-short-patch-repair endonuclease
VKTRYRRMPERVDATLRRHPDLVDLREQLQRPTFGVTPGRLRSRTPRVNLGEHLLAILKRELPAAADAAVRELRFHPIRQWRFDLAWPEQRVAAECDGGIYSAGRHVRGAAVEGDAEKVSVAAAMGWRVLRLTRKMIDDGRAVDLIGRALVYEREGET